MPGDPVPRAARQLVRRRREAWPTRFWRELGSIGAEHDPVVRLIVVERLAKSAVLVVAGIALLTAGRSGRLEGWVEALQDQLDLATDGTVVGQLVDTVLRYAIRLSHESVLAIGALLYAGLETTEGVGLLMRRRWAEYLTVLATGVLIPWELVEVVRRPTPFRIGALLLNVAVVVYLAYRKRLFVGV